MIRVVAIVTTKPGMRPELLAAFHDAQPAVLQEPGCKEYQATIDLEGAGPAQTPFGPDTIAIIETWETMADLSAHFVGDALKAYAKRTRELVASRAVHILTVA